MCSATSLRRDGVLKEIEQQVDEDPDKLLPLSLDEEWRASEFQIRRGNNDLKPYLVERNHLSFVRYKYNDALARLVEALQWQ